MLSGLISIWERFSKELGACRMSCCLSPFALFTNQGIFEEDLLRLMDGDLEWHWRWGEGEWDDWMS